MAAAISSRWSIVRIFGIELIRCRSNPRRPVQARPRLEPLESRRLLAATALPHSRSDVIMHNFGSQVVSDGSQPWGSLTRGGSGRSAVLFGETAFGGSSGQGTIFTIKPNGAGYRIIHSFAGGARDGAQPRYGTLQQVGNVLYGTTLRGGRSNLGVIFRVNTDGTGYAVIHAFTGSTRDGSLPYSSPTPAGSILIGMTSRGGANHQGTLYAINDDGTGFHILYSFAQATGTQPRGSLTIQHGALYGMTPQGGTAGTGVIFRFDLNTNQYVVLHQFLGGAGDGAAPDHGGLTVKGSQLFGLTTRGGRANDGVLFRIATSGAGFQVLHSFAPGGKNGVLPVGAPVLQGSTLYGTTSAGGRFNQGVVFQIGTSGRGFKVLHALAGPPSDGASPVDNLLVYKGKLYGTAKFGGAVPPAKPRTGDPPFDNGVIFAVPLSE
jgi:uncharacterized repeat protein (TIGR03803 family)